MHNCFNMMNGVSLALTLLVAINVASSFTPLGVGWTRHSLKSCNHCYSQPNHACWKLFQQSSDDTQPADIVRSEYAALEPGTEVKIQVGDVSLSRKAWKKRRRSGSPLLVPCSVLDMDRESMVRWNILWLVEKYGTPLNELQESLGFSGRGVALSHTQVNKLYKQHLGTSLNVSLG